MSQAPHSALGGVLAGLKRITARQDLVLVAIIIATVLMMVLPMPTMLADALIAVNLGIALILVLLTLYVKTPVEFSTLPSIILLTTAFRLSISITTSRLVLVQGDAGSIIRTFGEFVIAGNLVAGLVVYLIITVVQFVVITKGSERVAEVAARFTLDALPGKQISIDTDVRNGDLSQAEARRRRSLLEKESQLFGAMDGAMKFVKGDAIASLVIIAVNLIGGIAIGCLQRGLPFGQATQTYSLLAVGDGLIAQIPAFLVSLTAGLMVTRANAEEGGNLGEDILGQVTAHARPMQFAGLVLGGLSLVPGFPTLLFLGLGAALSAGGFLLARLHRRRAATAFAASIQSADLLPEPAKVSVRLGSGLQPVLATVDAALKELRASLGDELGIAIPRLPPEIDPGLGATSLCVRVDGVVKHTAGEITEDSVVAQVRIAVLRCAGDFVGIQETQALLSRLEVHYADLVREAGKVAPLPRLAGILRCLIEEQVSVRNLRGVLEAIAKSGMRDGLPHAMADQVRQALRSQICLQWADETGCLAVLVLEKSTQDLLHAGLEADGDVPPLVLRALEKEVRRWRDQQLRASSASPVLLAPAGARRIIHMAFASRGLSVPVLCQAELAPEFQTRIVGTIPASALQAGPPANELPPRLHLAAQPAAA